MHKVLYVRHGESERNVQKVFAGGNDNTPLTEKGREQARLAASTLKDEKIAFIVVSPMDRTKDTANIIADAIGFDKKNIQIEPGFQEYDIGSGNGKNVEGMTAAQMVSFPGAEDPAKFQQRVRQALVNVTKLPGEGTVLIVAHGGVGRIIECMRLGRSPSEFYDVPGYPNAEPVILDLNWLHA